MAPSLSRSTCKAVATVALICLSANAAIFVGIAVCWPAYLHDYRLNSNPDAIHYVRLGRNLLLHGHYSRCERPPYIPDMLRTPIYPLFSGGLDILGGAAAIYLAQSLLHVASCVLLFAIARRHLGRTTALFASFLLGTDLMLAVSNFEAMTEPLFTFLMLFSAYYLLGAMPQPRLRNGHVYQLLAGGLLLSLTILTRPAALYLLIIYPTLILAFGLKDHRLIPSLRAVALLFCITCIPIGLWVLRNYSTFSVAKLTFVDLDDIIYFSGAGAYQVEHGVSLERAQSMIAKDFGLTPVEVVQNDFLTDRPMAEINAELRSAWMKVVLKYPKSLALSSVCGLIKASLSHNTGQLATFLGRIWVAPGMGSLLRCRPEALERLRRSGPLLSAVCAWQVLHVVVTLGFALPGAILAVRDPQSRRIGFAVIIILAYFYLTIALVGFEAYYRFRISVLPFLYIFAALGMSRLCERLAGGGDCSPV